MALLDLLELEGRQFKRHIFRLGLGLFLSLTAAMTLLAGLLLVAWGIERWLAMLLGPVFSLLLVGGLLLLIAGTLGLWVRRLIR